MESPHPKHAVLIIGNRKIHEKLFAQIKQASAECVYFLVTDSLFAPLATELAQHVTVEPIFCDEISEFAEQAALLRRPVMIQYMRLKYAVKRVFEYERSHGNYFKYFHKIRPELLGFDISNLLGSSNQSLLDQYDGLYTWADYVFSGRREFFCPLAGLIEFEMSLENSCLQSLMPVNIFQANESKLTPKLSYTLEGEPQAIFNPGFMQYAKNFLDNYDTLVPNIDPLCSSNGCPEHIFSRFLNIAGIRIDCHTNLNLSCTLDPMRHARTATQEKLIQAITDSNHAAYHEIVNQLAEQAEILDLNYLCKIMYGGIDAISVGQIEAGKSLLNLVLASNPPRQWSNSIHAIIELNSNRN